MAATSTMLPLGTKAPEFNLPDTAGKRDLPAVVGKSVQLLACGKRLSLLRLPEG
jgi:hypothetical protein